MKGKETLKHMEYLSTWCVELNANIRMNTQNDYNINMLVFR